MEHSEALFPGGYRFFYDDALFRPGTDTFLLSAFPRLKKGARVLDLCCGTGLLGLILLQRQRDLFLTGVELLTEAASLAEKTAQANHLEDRMHIRCQDLRQHRTLFASGSFDLVVCNPPYYPAGSGALPADAFLQTARSESQCTLDDVCQAAAYSLRWGGAFCLVHKPERMTDVLCALRTHAMEPKRLRMVQTTPSAAPSLLFIEGRRGGKPGLTVEPPLILQQSNGAPTPEVDAIYFRIKEDLP